jgi:hypothetical protein
MTLREFPPLIHIGSSLPPSKGIILWVDPTRRARSFPYPGAELMKEKNPWHSDADNDYPVNDKSGSVAVRCNPVGDEKLRPGQLRKRLLRRFHSSLVLLTGLRKALKSRITE